VINEGDSFSADSPGGKAEHDERAANLLLLLLKPLAQKTIIALGNLYSLLTVASVFWLALQIIPNQGGAIQLQTTYAQLTGLGGYAVFVLIANFIVMRRRS